MLRASKTTADYGKDKDARIAKRYFGQACCPMYLSYPLYGDTT
jgi:hypothetical protein